jgi:hypothetical protein
VARRKKNLAARWETPEGWKAADGCTILGCGRKGIARGMCFPHYQRARRGLAVLVYLGVKEGTRYETVQKFGPAAPPLRVRRTARLAWDLATNWTPCPETGCWLWLGDYFPSGYGQAGNHRDPWGGYAHRAVLYFAGVELKRGRSLHIRHLCDVPACVNPAHLVYGTALENVADRERRYARGEMKRATNTRGNPRLSAEQVLAIREALAAGARQSDMAKRYGVNKQTVYSIAHRLTWTHLESPVPNPQQSAA